MTPSAVLEARNEAPARPAQLRTAETGEAGFRLLATMKQGTAASVPETWLTYPTVSEARDAGRRAARDDRVLRVMIVTGGVDHHFAEWV